MKGDEMKKNQCFALLIGLLLILSIGCNKRDDVVYQGKPVKAWIKMLKDEDPGNKMVAIKAISEIGPEAKEAVPDLIEMIRMSRNHDKRFLLASVNALLAMGKEIVPDMIDLLKDDDWEIRRGGVWMLGKLGSEAKDAVPALTEALNDPNEIVRMKAGEALKKIKGETGEVKKPGPNPDASALSGK